MVVPDLWGVMTVGAAFGSVWAVARLMFRVSLGRVVLEACFVAYLVALLFVTVFAYWYPGRDEPALTWWMVNLVPLRTIIELARPEHVTQAVRQLLGNIVMFVPFGVLLPAIGARYRSLGHFTLAALTASISIELLQLILRLAGVMSRSIDVDDVILNTAGALIGWSLWRLAYGALRSAGRPGSKSSNQGTASDACPTKASS
jgi:glycopeptide antibiotics resistance protein